MFRRIAGAIVLTIGKALKFKKEERVMEERVSQEIKKEEKMEVKDNKYNMAKSTAISQSSRRNLIMIIGSYPGLNLINVC